MPYLLLSGATGLLGRYLLRDLLSAGVPVAVLARRSIAWPAACRIDGLMRHWESTSNRAWPRPVVLEADLLQPDLGLGPRQFDWIRRHVGGVLHSAASLTFYASASSKGEPYRTNVEGTRSMLAMCRLAGIERFFHVSTAYVAGLRRDVAREDELDVGQTWANDYERSKVEAERLARAAGFRHATTVFRPSIIIGDSKTAYTSTYHGFYAPLKAALELAGGARASRWNQLPSFQSLLGLSGDERKNLVPVDWVSSVMTHIITHEELHGRCYHITNSEPTPVTEIENGLLDAAKAGVTPARQGIADAPSPQLEAMFREGMQTYQPYFRDDTTFDTTNTRQAVPHLPCPAVHRALLARLAMAAIRTNFGWPKPPELPLDFDVEAMLAKLERPRVAPRDSRSPLILGLDVSGSGGGQWQLTFAGGALANFEPGLPEIPAARGLSVAVCSLNVDTLRAIAGGEISSAEAALAGRLLIERGPGITASVTDLLQQVARPDSAIERPAIDAESNPTVASTPTRSPAPSATPAAAVIPAPAAACPSAHSPPKTRLAIVGMACRLPGAEGLEAYWDLLARGGSAVTELPPHRLDRSLYYDPRKGAPGKTYSTLGGMIAERELDRSVCPLPPELVASSDPAHVILCEVAAAAWRHAGYDPFALPSRNVGVYIGHSAGSELATEIMLGTMAQHWAESLRELPSFAELPAAEQDAAIADVVARIRRDKPRRDISGGPQLEANAAAALIARVMGLDGPQMVLDAACASSLTALALAAMALERGTVDAALVGGASYNKCVSLLLFSQAHSCSATGSRPFDAEADGLISSEGYVTLIVKTLERAIADGDTVHAVIRGIGISSDGRGRSLWAPRKEGQIEAVRRAYDRGARLDQVQYIETHATSTQVGDATEVEALASVFRDHTPPGRKIPIGSVKSNVGHTLETAGLAGLLKVVLAMKHGRIPASIGVRRLNPEVDWAGAPLEVAATAREWPRPGADQPRMAAVNAFGIGGLNIHVAISEAPPAIGFSASAAPASARIAGARVARAAADVVPGPLPAAAPEADPVAIIGRGVILPGARSIAEFWDLLSSGRDATSLVSVDRWRSSIGFRPGEPQTWRSVSRRGGFIRDYAYDWKRHKVPPRQIANANPLQFMLLDAADQALGEAGYLEKPFDRRRAAVVVGNVFGGDFCTQMNLGLRRPELQRYLSHTLGSRGVSPAHVARVSQDLAAMFDRTIPALHDETGSFTASTLASRLSKTFDLMGGAMAIDAGSASSLAALSAASDLLLTGRCDMVLCAAAQQGMDLPSYETLSLMGLLTDDSPKAPFDRDAQGQVPGEGVVVLLLKRLSAAVRDGDRVLGVVRSVGAAASAENPQAAQIAASRRAQALAGVASADILAVEAGSGVPRLDALLAESLGAVYGAQPRRSPLRVGSTIAQLGHLQGAQGLVSLVKATLEHEHRPSLANAGLAGPALDPAHAAVFQPASKTMDLSGGASAALVAVQSPARCGLVYEAVMEYPARARVDRSAAADKEIEPAIAARMDCQNKSQRAAADSLVAAARLAPAAAGPAARSPSPSAPSPLRSPERRWPTAPQVAFVFPGQGSQYAGMLGKLLAEDPAAREACGEADAVLSSLGCPTFAELSDDAGRLLGKDVRATQLAVLMADYIMLAALAARGVRPDRVTGHSFGELAALVACGAWTLETAIRATCGRSAAVVACAGSSGALLACAATPEALASLASRLGAPVCVTHHNSPSQTVIGGPESAVAAMSAALREERVAAQRIDVPCAYHTRLMTPAQEPFRAALADLAISPPRTPMLSGVGARYVAEPDQIRANLVAQLVEPALWVDQIRRLADEGARMFVEVGPQKILTRLNGQILAGRDATVIACDDAELGAEQLDRVADMWKSLVSDPGAAIADAALAAPVGIEPIPSAPPKSLANDSPAIAPRVWPIEHFDATRTRREKARGEARAPQGGAVAAGPPVAQFDASALRRQRNGSGGVGGPAAMSVSAAGSAPPPLAGAVASQARPGRFEAMLIDFVVEQTGYPPEVVRLDADLEADLGIDSIKKAQLFGELREQFDLRPTGQFKLSDFTTLRAISEFLESCADTTADNDSAAESDVAAGASERSAAPAIALAPPSIAPAASTEAARSAAAPAPAAARPRFSADQLAAQLVDFVVEQTGYPPEVVRFEADLEADLGIDSIKKAQLFGELREQYALTPQPGLKLSDFPTLGHIFEYLQARLADAPADGRPDDDARADGALADGALAGARPAARSYGTDIHAAGARAAAPALPASPVFAAARSGARFERGPLDVSPWSAPGERLLELSGSPYDMGRAHGLAMSREVKKLLRRIAELPAPWRPGFEPCSLEAAAHYLGPSELEELQGIAEGAGVDLANVIAHNLSLAPDYAAGCTQFAVTAADNGGEMLHAVNEDAPLALRAPMALLRVVQSRRPARGMAYVTFSIAGQFGGFNGVNSSGLAVTSTLLLDRPAPPPKVVGLVHAAVVKSVLEGAADLETAVERVRNCRRLGAWSMCLSHHPSDRLCYLEYDHEQVLVDHRARRVFSTNHSLLRPQSTAPDHSTYRLARLESMLGGGRITLEAMQAALRDRHDGERGRVTEHATMNTVCRVDNQVSIVMRPAAGEVWATPGAAAGEAADAFFMAPVPREEAPAARQPRPAAEYEAPAAPPEAPAARGPSPDASEPAAAPGVAARYLLRMAEKPLVPHADPTPNFCGAALVVGDNPAAGALGAELERLGVRVFAMPEILDPDSAAAELDRIWLAAPVPHLFLLTPRDPEAITRIDETHWQRRQTRGVLGPYFLCQQWLKLVAEAGLMDRASLVAATSLGGDFGFSGQIPSVESGALAGLLKSMAIESWVAGYRAIPIKVVDMPPEAPPADVARAMLDELAASSYDVEIGYPLGKRSVPRAFLAPLDSRERRPIPRGGVWVCTGGARGITAYVAGELGERYGLKLHLIGTAPAPDVPPEWLSLGPAELKRLRSEVSLRARRENQDPLEAWRDVEKAIEIDATLRAMAARGIRATYHSCDVSDRQALAATLAEVRRMDGPIEGVLHGAGYGKDMRFDRKQRDKVERCVRAKTDGAAALMELTAGDPLRYFVAFGSISGRFGANGHTDYSLANDMLAKQVGWLRRRRPECAAVAFHWHAWGDVGMATKPETKLALELIDMQFMPAREGLAHLIAELEAGAPEGEALITDDRYYRLFFHAETLVADAASATGSLTADALRGAAPPALLAGAETNLDADGATTILPLDPTREPFLLDHRLAGRPLLPVAVSLELLAEAALLASAGRPTVEIRRIDIVNGLKFFTDEPQSVRVTAQAPRGGASHCRLSADVRTRDGRLVVADRALLEGDVILGEAIGGRAAARAQAIDLAWSAAPKSGWRVVAYPAQDAAAEDAMLYVGPSMRCLRKIAVEPGRIWGKIVAPALVELAGPRRRVEGWQAPSAILDACLHAVGTLAAIQAAPGMSLPRYFEQLTLGQLPQPGEICLLRAELRERTDREATYDFCLVGGDGRMLLVARGYRVSRIGAS